MRTTLIIDDILLERARELSGIQEKTSLVRAGLEALIVAVDGQVERAVGGIYHVTHSLSEGRAKVESNTVIEQHGWTPIASPFAIDGLPAWND